MFEKYTKDILDILRKISKYGKIKELHGINNIFLLIKTNSKLICVYDNHYEYRTSRRTL